MDWRKFTLFACLGSLSITLSTWAANVNFSRLCHTVGCNSSQPEEPSNRLSIEQLQHQAQAITVKVMSRDFLGSGIILRKQGPIYTVLTNAHVLQAGEAPYRVQTPDGRIYKAALPKNLDRLYLGSLQGNDLAVLQFRSTGSVYAVSFLGAKPAVEDEVFAGGFPSREDASQDKGFAFTAGKVSLVLPKALKGGYQVGYTNAIAKGMSGGPLINRLGQVVGVNGKHAYPLWDTPSVFADGKEADPALHQQIIHLSWAVPIETIRQFK
ncbi:serine protease [Aetokthonos hydrillicola Thurmond2011]|jgi:S1-C subfamily serine protease|uniref:Serine protease n=1 Tax=Aetokthonos hydrillicola Thurmond2011 TaxID=2712845 RepID=A0AAP5I9S9_9CYAN|nr:serine protease [Aetokthonos hydrillicola]MBO3458817.1 trypsin-like peptidase domain-containing protein [Aetokthonos hydrillicola CCALA 1050]MBW4585563.1 serine protease [Aetokthonos hydrillicola CCALA 1050]MDR9896187.1 serine protease [Aetokthonos hydrillicola Thurmond2011]